MTACWNKKASTVLAQGNKTSSEIFEGVGTLNLPMFPDYTAPQKVSCDPFAIDSPGLEIIQKLKSRNLVVQTAVYTSCVESDTLHKGKFSILLSFFLSTGCYATMLVDQLIRLAEDSNE